MQFANRKNIKQDPLLNIFQTFSTIYGFVSNPLLKFTETSDIVSTVVNTAKQSSANVIVIPQAAVVGEEAVVGDASSWLGDDATQTTRQLAHSVWLAVPSISVVRFIDRGFLNPSSGVDSTSLPQSILQPRYNNTPSKLGGESTTPTPLNPTTVTIVLITAGLSDSSEEESIRIVQHLTSSDTISQQSIHFSVHILRVGAAAAAAAAAAGNLTNSGALSIASEISLKSDMTTRTVGIRDAVEEQIEEGAIPSLSSRVAALATGHKDLVVVGVSALKEFESKHQHQQQFIIEGGKQSGGVGGGGSTGGFENWLEYESAASIAIVYGTRN
ncbi:hypothetical protein BDR26DRAFT_7522 [Obelidium mucronatum]|nr:hypothetical protein BDR26DRAFT_7522 [Obelidium mucronatum]